MIVCLALSPALDISYRLGRLEPGEVNRVATVREQPGGKGVNVAAVARDLGLASRVVLPLGGDVGRAVATRLEQAGIDARIVPIQAATRRTVTIVADDGHPTGVYEPPAELSAAERRALVERALAECTADDVLVVSGRMPPGMPAEELGVLVADARRRHVRVVVDTSGPLLLTAAEAGATALKPNRAELEEATGESDWRVAARRLLRAGAGSVFVSLGADGLVACSPQRMLRTVGLPRVDGNPTGAGDAVVAVLAGGLADRAPAAEIVRRAAAAGAAAVLQPVAGVVEPGDVARFAEQITIEEETWRW